MKVYGDTQSGNCYKVKLVCALLGIEYEWQDVDILSGEASNIAFLAKNPNGKIPVLELADGRCLSESNAIINYLAAGSSLLPNQPFVLAKIQQWQFFEQYSHEPNIAVARFIAKYLGLPEERKNEYQAKQKAGKHALTVMQQQLSESPYLVGDQITNADIALYAYTHVAHEAGIELTEFPAIEKWITRVASQPHYVGMQ
ncbi:glutathione S-transferase family protein [Paraglaciecola aestuariivivens]